MLPDPLIITRPDWEALKASLHARTRGVHESGAFLLGLEENGARRVVRPVYYDELDGQAYRFGIVVLGADSFTRLWAICRAEGLSVIADVHVHPREAWQSHADRTNPMIAQAGHLAMILPWFAAPPLRDEEIGLYRYRGSHRWHRLGGRYLHRHFRIEDQA